MIAYENEEYNRALELFKEATYQGNAFAYAHIGIMYHQGEGCEKNEELALSAFREGAKQGCPLAACWITEFYRMGYAVEKDKEYALKLVENQRIIAGNAQFTGIAAGRGVGFTTGLLLLRKGLGMRETPIRPHSWHCRMQSGYQYGGNRKRPPVWRRHRGSLRPRGRNLGGVEGMTGGCGSGCDPAIHARRLRVYHRPRRLRMASRISIFFAARRFEPLNSMG